MTDVVQLVVNGLLQGGIYGLVALGLVMIYKSSDILNFAHGEAIMFSAFLGVTFMDTLGLPAWTGIILSMACMAVLGPLIERLLLRPLVGQPVLAILIVTLALGFLMRGVAFLLWPGLTEALPQFLPSEPIEIGAILLSQHYLWAFFIALLAFVIMVVFFQYTRQGLGMRAVAGNHQVARACGVGVTSVFAQTWAISLALAGIAGILLGSLQAVTLDLAEVGLSKAIPAMLLGGLESLPGALIGGIIVGVVENIGGFYIDPLVGGGVKDIVPFVLALLILIFKPYGLFGQKRIERI
ncbi:MAG: branched-chain amino acid ABC transporter permease [Chloroflexota bacterium]|nr:branched-chain amino acid ABC transporter permease [Chloroflexota bacterium]